MGSIRRRPRGSARVSAPPRRYPVVVAVVLVAVLSCLSNWITTAEVEAGLRAYQFARRTFSQLVNAGAVWAGLAVLAGRRADRWWTAPLWGVVAAEATLVLHYGLGQVLGLYGGGIWASNLAWFVIALPACAVCGVLGFLSRRSGWLGLAMRCVVPLGAVAEPFVMGWFELGEHSVWYRDGARVLAGILLVFAGLGGMVVALRRGRTAG